ncbi:hypothetical protein [Parageobacillus thermoglucosidasius]|uniref:hypothetical protein n=1 Tax=Parageobacillus thermoglucosidasius TaxID=1426 RepID=UPI001626E7EF|nr:hypothetical protein [Parageobacillus thermoglucosidasius]MED4905453.1 hypothetical protein [Parageobacillus thermoglucosidasius]MED4913852.1 hypothetical protein [Parageobacillus thermoglucosidasius]MED4943831.1 hypothetical protein [Parageobacillus thermoglucosidasius]MED4983651.1 hypothetical protein [Parageobacillus thermoglucosidasius]
MEHVLRRFREKNLKTAHIPESVPIRITENGWSTGKHPFTGEDRSYEHQAKVLEAVIRTVYALRQELNIMHYELFGLRDADSSVHDLFHQFGIMRDDYTPKPAFYTFQRLYRSWVFDEEESMNEQGDVSSCSFCCFRNSFRRIYPYLYVTFT